MPSSTSVNILSALAAAVTVSAHGFVQEITIDGVAYEGYNVFKHPYQPEVPTVVGWTNTATDSGFVSPDKYNTPDIICHLDATNAKGHARVAAGGSVWLQWNDWPESHSGPVLDYLASCGDDGCESVDKTDLKFFKIDEKGLIDGSSAPGHYAADELFENGKGWMVQIPESIKPGFYVLRHEIIALHSAHEKNGAQNYPQCINLEITGSGTEQPEGVPGMELYKADDAGIFFNIYMSRDSYPIPGPAVMKGAGSVKQPSPPKATTTASATTGTKLSPAPTGDSSDDATSAAPAPPAATTEAASSGSDDSGAELPAVPAGPTKTQSITPKPSGEASSPAPVEEAPAAGGKPPASSLPICKKGKKSKGKGKKSKKAKRAVKAPKMRRGAIPRVF